MFVDMFGTPRLKIGLHTHTSLTDGYRTPEETAALYREEGYDAIAVTDHWLYYPEGELEGLKILPGIEYNLGTASSQYGTYHIVAVGMSSDPHLPIDWRDLEKTSHMKAEAAIKEIEMYNGLVILAHPARSLNTPEQLSTLDYDVIEIYNGVSDRPYSGTIIDQLAASGKITPIIAADDTHYYEGDMAQGYIMVEAMEFDTQSIVRAIKNGKFYSTQGPEVHLKRISETKLKVYCSPCSKVVFLSNTTQTEGKVVRGDGLVEVEYAITPLDTFVRAEVTDADGRTGWSNIIKI